MVGFLGDLGVFGGFLGLSIKYNRYKLKSKSPISIYNNCSTL